MSSLETKTTIFTGKELVGTQIFISNRTLAYVNFNCLDCEITYGCSKDNELKINKFTYNCRTITKF